VSRLLQLGIHAAPLIQSFKTVLPIEFLLACKKSNQSVSKTVPATYAENSYRKLQVPDAGYGAA
jgi:hypothetical protein